MSSGARLITRIAVFSALVYVLSWGTSYLPNVNLAFFVVFCAGYLWGAAPGLLVGAVGMGLWTNFNPYGPATLPVMLAQVVGMATCGLVGSVYQRTFARLLCHAQGSLMLILAGMTCTVVFYVPVSLVDAWVYQPFWPRLWAGLAFMGVSLGANVIIFPLLFAVLRRLYERETTMLC